MSSTFNNNELMYAAGRAIDLKFYTCARAKEDSEQQIWLKVTLKEVFCVEKVMRYHDYTQIHTWTCSNNDCGNCEGEYCSDYTLTVSGEGAGPELSPVSDCGYGNTVKLLRTTRAFSVGELVVIGNKGKTVTYKMLIFCSSFCLKSKID